MADTENTEKFTQIPNHVLEALAMIRIPGEPRQILDVILRKTLGWHKISDRISLSQFQELTGMKKPSIVRAIKTLLAMNLITVNPKHTHAGNIYAINMDQSSWIPLSKRSYGFKTLKEEKQ